MDIAENRDGLAGILGPRGRADIALVPTMGALHAGHAALIRRAARLAPRVVVTVFVNPLQFGPGEDLARYPRDLAGDAALAREAGATCMFAPGADDLTPAGAPFSVDPGPMADALCGASRPGHFRGVATIVAKLFHLVSPRVAVFGWKDAQQLLLLRRMAVDLDFGVEIAGMDTVREPDGLALSSRNRYLSPPERRRAPAMARGLAAAGELARAAAEQGRTADARELEDTVAGAMEREGGFRVDYVSCVDAHTLESVDGVAPGGRALLAAAGWIGATRLIDNVRLGEGWD